MKKEICKECLFKIDCDILTLTEKVLAAFNKKHHGHYSHRIKFERAVKDALEHCIYGGD